MSDHSTSELVRGWHEVQGLIDQAIAATTLTDLYEVGSKICHTFDFEYFLFTMYFATSLFAPRSVVVCNHPTWWCERYLQMNYQKVDPIARHCRMRSTPVQLDRAESRQDVPLDAREAFIAEAQSAGLRSGLGVPLHGTNGEWGMLILNSELPQQAVTSRVANAIPFATLLAAYMQESARRIVLNRTSIHPEYKLTQREKECLVWVAEGKTSWETSKILSISERTVIYHLQNVVQKLDVVNRAQAVAKATALLLADPDLVHTRKDRDQVRDLVYVRRHAASADLQSPLTRT